MAFSYKLSSLFLPIMALTRSNKELFGNFHLPKSSLLLLVSAMIGRERLLSLYKKAIREKFRFFSYGDAMYITPEAFLEGSKTKH